MNEIFDGSPPMRCATTRPARAAASTEIGQLDQTEMADNVSGDATCDEATPAMRQHPRGAGIRTCELVRIGAGWTRFNAVRQPPRRWSTPAPLRTCELVRV